MYQQQNSQGCLSYFNPHFIAREKAPDTEQALITSQALIIGLDPTLNLKNQHHNPMYCHPVKTTTGFVVAFSHAGLMLLMMSTEMLNTGMQPLPGYPFI